MFLHQNCLFNHLTSLFHDLKGGDLLVTLLLCMVGGLDSFQEESRMTSERGEILPHLDNKLPGPR